jgi:hypothetical protein
MFRQLVAEFADVGSPDALRHDYRTHAWSDSILADGARGALDRKHLLRSPAHSVIRSIRESSPAKTDEHSSYRDNPTRLGYGLWREF